MYCVSKYNITIETQNPSFVLDQFRSFFLRQLVFPFCREESYQIFHLNISVFVVVQNPKRISKNKNFEFLFGLYLLNVKEQSNPYRCCQIADYLPGECKHWSDVPEVPTPTLRLFGATKIVPCCTSPSLKSNHLATLKLQGKMQRILFLIYSNQPI